MASRMVREGIAIAIAILWIIGILIYAIWAVRHQPTPPSPPTDSVVIL